MVTNSTQIPTGLPRTNRAHALSLADPCDMGELMTFNGICLVTRDVRRVRQFYEAVLKSEFHGDETFAWLDGASGTFSIFGAEGMEKMAPGSMKGAGHGSYTIEFEVDDVDAEFERLKGIGVQFVKEPTTQSWRRRSMWFRDPDGNIVNFYKSLA
jgi:catechol 2,3-dioxygenase-like lactoylglutathione lyase family enzyme